MPINITSIALALLTASYCLFCPSAHPNTASISWVKLDFPPNYIIKGDNAGNGVYEQIIRFIGAELTQYDMRLINMSRKRFWHEVARGQNYCDVGVQKTLKRQHSVYYTVPITLIPPAQIVLNEEKWQALGNPKSMKLENLLNNNRLKGAVMSKRSYGTSIDALLAKDEKNLSSNLQRKYIKLPSLFSMVALQRLDYTIDYDAVVNLFIKDKSWHNLKLVEIAEELEYHSLHIACTKNPWGKRVIANIDVVLLKHRTSAFFRKSFDAYGVLFNGDFYQRYKDALEASR